MDTETSLMETSLPWLLHTPGGCCVVTPCRIHTCSFSSSPIVTLAGVWCLGAGRAGRGVAAPCYRPSVARSCCLPAAPRWPGTPQPGRQVHHCNVDTAESGHEGHEGGRVSRGSRGCHEGVTRMSRRCDDAVSLWTCWQPWPDTRPGGRVTLWRVGAVRSLARGIHGY